MKLEQFRPMFRHIALSAISIGFVTNANVVVAAKISPVEIQSVLKRAEVSTQNTNGQLRLVITSWEHRWECSEVGNSCESKFNGSAKMVRQDGTAVKWNLVESWAQDDCGANPSDARWFKSSTDTENNSFGWGKKDGKANHASAYLRFTGGEGVVTAFVKSKKCP